MVQQRDPLVILCGSKTRHPTFQVSFLGVLSAHHDCNTSSPSPFARGGCLLVPHSGKCAVFLVFLTLILVLFLFFCFWLFEHEGTPKPKSNAPVKSICDYQEGRGWVCPLSHTLCNVRSMFMLVSSRFTHLTTEKKGKHSLFLCLRECLGFLNFFCSCTSVCH